MKLMTQIATTKAELKKAREYFNEGLRYVDDGLNKIDAMLLFLKAQEDYKIANFLEDMNNGVLVHPERAELERIEKATNKLPTDVLQLNNLKQLDISENPQGETEIMNTLKNKLYEKGNGLKEYRFTHSGRQYSVYGRTYTEVYRKYIEKKNTLKKEPVKKQTRGITFYEWLDKWFVLYKENKIAKATQKTYLSYIVRIKKGIKDVRLNKLEPVKLQEFLNTIKQTRTRKAFHMNLNDCLNKAVKMNFIKYNPINAVESVKHEYEKSKALTISEETEFNYKLDKLENKELAIYYKFCLLTGCRREEALNVKWTDIDFENKVLHLPGTKTAKSDRLVPLSDRLIDILSDLKHNTEYLFNLQADYVTKSFKKLMPKHHLHELRHTFATRCLEKGVSMKTLQLWLGHATYKQTADTYSHVLEAFNKSEIDKLNK